MYLKITEFALNVFFFKRIICKQLSKALPLPEKKHHLLKE